VSTHDSPSFTPEEILSASSKPIAAWLKTASAALTVIGALVFIAGLFLNPDRAWRALHMNWLFFACLSSAAVMFVAAQRITTARWSRPVIRFLEGYVAFLPVAFVLLALTVLVGKGHVFTWTHEQPATPEKQLWLDPTFFTLRVLGIFLLITLLSVWFVYTSVRLDVGRIPEWGAGWARGLRERMRRGFGDERREIHSTHSRQGTLAVVLGVVWGFGWVILSFDLSMSLDLHFQSTLYGWWFFMNGWLGALMAFALTCLAWRRHLARHDLINDTHFHDIGKLCFAFTAFFGYLSFGQYLVIWYGNLPEETHWPRLRFLDPYRPLTVAAMFLAFFLPFGGLISRAAKLYKPTLILFTLCGLLGTWLVRYLETYPSFYPDAPSTGVLRLGIWEVGIFLLYLGLWGLCYIAFMNAFPRMRVTLMTSPYRDEMQVPEDPKTMEPLPAHE
jgi:hypothetical protein